ncbi:MAG: hypothetical protein EOP56_00135 [Sphingobacteriales bacterium]|nr:MAG: hypothetical protein EOP56_00135 [Sphingobacteriales bacterium]
MKFSWLSRVLLLAVLSVSIYSCDKDDPTPTPQEPIVAGKGGMTTLRIVPIHDSINIDSCTVYLKYNSLDMPSSFDDSVYCTWDGTQYRALFPGLKRGNYFIYAKGWDVVRSQKTFGYLYHVITDTMVYHTIKLEQRVQQ